MKRRRFTILVALAFAGAPPVLARHTAGSGQALLTRRYHDGETSIYRMTGLDQSARYRVLGKATTDKALTNCDAARPRRIHRRIEMRLDSPRR